MPFSKPLPQLLTYVMIIQNFQDFTTQLGNVYLRSKTALKKRLLLLFKEKSEMLLFLTFSVLVANPKKTTLHGGQSARGLLNREERTKEKVWQHTPPPHPPTLLVRRKINKITRRIYRRYAGLFRSRVRTRIPSARRQGQWVWLRKILHSRLR